MKRLRSLACAAAAAALLACAKGTEPSAPITVSTEPPTLALRVGETSQITVDVQNSAKGVRWSSSNPAIVGVMGGGNVVGMAAGTALVTATSLEDGTKSAATAVTVSTPVFVSLSPSSRTLAVGEWASFAAIVSGTPDARVTWSSSATAIASVDASGVVQGRAPGTAVIRATSLASPASSGSATVVVTAAPSNTVTIVVTNSLRNAINISVNGVAQGSVPGGETRQTVVPRASSISMAWTLVRSTTTVGGAIGDQIGGTFSPVVNPADRVNYTVNAVIGTDFVFRPVIVNQTATTLVMGVNEGLQAQNRCNCTVPAFSTGTAIGYYWLYSNSNVRGYRSSSGYTGGYVFWSAFSAQTDRTTGDIWLTASTPPPAPGLDAAGAAFAPAALEPARVWPASDVEDYPTPGLREEGR